MPNVLILSKDPTLFPSTQEAAIGDTRKRHIYYAKRLRERFPNSQIRILTYTKRGTGRFLEKPCDGLTLLGTHSHHRAFYVFDLSRRLLDLFSDGWRPDLITVQTPWEEGVVGLIAARLLGAKFLPQLHFDLFSREWAKESWLNPFNRAIAFLILKKADSIRVVSTTLRKKLVSRLAIPECRVLVAPVGVRFTPIVGNKNHHKTLLDQRLKDRKVILFVGRLCAQKNLGLWVDVARLVRSRCSSVAFLIVGDGPDEMWLRQRVNEDGLHHQFIFVGRKTHDALPPYYAAADVFLLTSHYEGFGRVVLEALLSAVPVVSTACTGPEDLIKSGYNGYLLPCGDAKGLSEHVVELLQNESKAVSMGCRGHLMMNQKFSLQALTDSMIDTWLKA